MDFRQLQYFALVADSGSFRAAAGRANIAQSALSRHIKILDEELGVKLLERHARGISLTPEGERMKERTSSILRELADIRYEMSATKISPRGNVTIGASATSSRLLYARLAEIVSQRYPLLELNITEGASYFLLEGLDTGRVDLAIMVNPEPRTYFTIEPLVTESVYLIGSTSHCKFPAANCTVDYLKGKPLILLSRPSGSRMMLEAAAAKENIKLDVRFEATSPDVIKDFVRRGLGYGLMPYSSIVSDIKGGELIGCRVQTIELTRTLIKRIDRPASAAVDIIGDLVRSLFVTLHNEGVFGK